jgi:transcriptional regulator with XRE-family HTH domain
MDNHGETRTLLGVEIRKRLKQMGISGRELCKAINLSRQTLHSLEHESGRGFAPTTFEAIDRGLFWPMGTAEAYFRGVVNAKDQIGGWSVEERVSNYLQSILKHLATMTVDELEREVLILETESYGRPLRTDSEALAVIRETVRRLENEILRDRTETTNGT